MRGHLWELGLAVTTRKPSHFTTWAPNLSAQLWWASSVGICRWFKSRCTLSICSTDYHIQQLFSSSIFPPEVSKNWPLKFEISFLSDWALSVCIEIFEKTRAEASYQIGIKYLCTKWSRRERIELKSIGKQLSTWIKTLWYTFLKLSLQIKFESSIFVSKDYPDSNIIARSNIR